MMSEDKEVAEEYEAYDPGTDSEAGYGDGSEGQDRQEDDLPEGSVGAAEGESTKDSSPDGFEQPEYFSNEDADDAETFSQESIRHGKQVPELSDEQLDMVADTSLDVIRGLLYYFNAEDTRIDEYEGDEQELIFDIIGENMALLIGRHGHTLDAFQYVVGSIVTRRIGFHYPIVVDVEGYVNRRKQKLISLAKSAAARAVRQKHGVKLRPMNPYERRIIHMALKDDARVRTSSEGAEPNRQVVISVN